MDSLDWPKWPQYDKAHEDAVLRVIRTNQLFAAAEVESFEYEFRSFVNTRYAIGVGNATQGLQLALAALGIGAGDEVIVTPYSWISSASCVLMQNAIPVFVDIETESFGISPAALKNAITPRTKAVILVHMFGLCSKIEDIKKICEQESIELIEDASHAHGARLNRRHLGTFGKIGVFSLHQRKAIPAGDGGILCTNNSYIYEKLRRLRSFGEKQLSYNYRMTEFAAAIARVGLRRLEAENNVRRNNHDILKAGIKNDRMHVVKAADEVEPVYYSNLVLIDMPKDDQEYLLSRANSLGIPLKRTWQPLNKHPHFRRSHMINKVAPWDGNSEGYQEPASLELGNSRKYQEHLLFELECHPLVNKHMVEKSAWILNQLAS
jgi:dTDP-4-amino-4,6-dideoxygalactose transaminase